MVGAARETKTMWQIRRKELTMSTPIDFNLVQLVISKLREIAMERFGEPFTTEINLWNDGTFSVVLFQYQHDHNHMYQRVLYISSTDQYISQSWNSEHAGLNSKTWKEEILDDGKRKLISSGYQS
jgi:hypothetical protein